MNDIQIAAATVITPRPSRPQVRDTLIQTLPELQALCVDAFGSDGAAETLRQALTEAACYMIGHAGAATTKPFRQRTEKALRASQSVLEFLDGLPPQYLAAMCSEPTDPDNPEAQQFPLLLHGYQQAQEFRAGLVGFIAGVQAFQRRLPAGQKGRPNRSDPIEFLVEACLSVWEQHGGGVPTSSQKRGGLGAFVKDCADLAVAAAGGDIPGYRPDTIRNALQRQLRNRAQNRRRPQTDEGSSAES